MMFRVIAFLLALTLGASAQVGQIPAWPPIQHFSGGGSFSVTVEGTNGSATSGSSTALTSWTYGSGCKTVLVGVVYGPAALGVTITALTLDGTQAMTAVSGSFFDNSANGGGDGGFYYIANPTGSSGTPTITFSGAIQNGMALQAWCIQTTTTTPTAGNGNGVSSATSVSAPPTTVPSGGAIFGMCTGLGGPETWVFTNFSLDSNITFHNQFGTANAGSGHATGGTGASVTLTCADAAVNNGNWVLTVAAMAP